jgi:hypothetical protein
LGSKWAVLDAADKSLTSEELARGAVQVFWLDVGGIQHLMAKLQVAINKTNHRPVIRN